RRDDLGRAECAARHREVGRDDRIERGLAREELEARFLGGEARGEARGAAVALAGVAQLGVGEELREVLARRIAEEPLDARDLDAVDAAAWSRGAIHRGAYPCAVEFTRG